MGLRSTSWYVRLNGSFDLFSVVRTLTWPLCLASLPQMQEFGSNYEAETLRNSKHTDLADVIVYIYDSSDTNSFSYISNLRVSIVPNLNAVPIKPNLSKSGIWCVWGLKFGITNCVFVAYIATIQPRLYPNALRGHQVGFRLGPAGTLLSLHISINRCHPWIPLLTEPGIDALF